MAKTDALLKSKNLSNDLTDLLVNEELLFVPQAIESESFEYVRKIEFTIPGDAPTSGLHILVKEVEDGLSFIVSTLDGSGKSTDVRGLFFNINDALKLSGLVATGNDVSDQQLGGANDLGNGANVKGKADTFDIGIEFGSAGKAKDAITQTEFHLSNSTGDLTLDDIANVEFAARVNGLTHQSSKINVVAPASPDANDDVENIFEDGAIGLGDPSTVPNGIQFNVLNNDTDADGDKLTIINTRGAQHGTVTIIDGNDADDLVGDAVLYVPDEDYSGVDSFQYLIDDGNGGTDFATVSVNIEAVADTPDLSYQVLRGPTVNQIILRVDSAQTDADGSEFIDRFELTATNPDGSSFNLSSYIAETIYNPDAESLTETHDFLISLPKFSDTDFNLNIRAIAKEKSNADEQYADASLHISSNAQSQLFSQTFIADDHSIWHGGDAFNASASYTASLKIDDFKPTDTIGAYKDIDTRVAGVGVTAAASGQISEKLDFEVSIKNTFNINGGTVDANVKYDGNINSFYNHTTDWLQFETSATPDLMSSRFWASTPKLTFEQELLKFAAAADIQISGAAYMQVHTGGSSHDIFNQQPFADVHLYPSFGIDNQSLVRFDGDKLHLLNGLYTKDSLSGTIDDALQNTLVEWKFSAPQFSTSSSGINYSDQSLYGSNSDDFLELRYDLDGIAASLAGKPNPLDLTYKLGNDTVSADFNVEVVDYDLVNPYKFGQDYELDLEGLNGLLTLEDESEIFFEFGDTIDVFDASQHDLNGDGVVEYALTLTPDALFETETNLIVGLQDELDILKGNITLNAGPVSYSTPTLGPVYELDGTLVSTAYSKEVTSQKFAFDLGSTELDSLMA